MTILERELLSYIQEAYPTSDSLPMKVVAELSQPDKDGFYKATAEFAAFQGIALSRSPAHALGYALNALADDMLREIR